MKALLTFFIVQFMGFMHNRKLHGTVICCTVIDVPPENLLNQKHFTC